MRLRLRLQVFERLVAIINPHGHGAVPAGVAADLCAVLQKLLVLRRLRSHANVPQKIMLTPEGWLAMTATGRRSQKVT